MLGDVTCGGDRFMSAWGGNLGLSGVRGSMNSGKSSAASSVGTSIIKFSGWKKKGHWVHVCHLCFSLSFDSYPFFTWWIHKISFCSLLFCFDQVDYRIETELKNQFGWILRWLGIKCVLLLCASIVLLWKTVQSHLTPVKSKSPLSLNLQVFWLVAGFIFGNLLAKLKGFSHKQRLLQTLVLKKSRISGSRYEEQIQLPDLESTVQSLPVAVAGASLDPVFLFKHRSLVSIVVWNNYW